jgi:hypothetical protein
VTILHPDLSVDELKDRVDKQLDGDDPLLTDYLAAAWLQAQAPAPYGCGRNLTPDPELAPGASENDPPIDTLEPVERVLRPGGARGRHVLVPDAREIVSVTADGTALTVDADTDGYEVLKRDGHVVRITLTAGRRWCDGRWTWDQVAQPTRAVTVVGRFGFAVLPDHLKEAIYQLASRMYLERDAQQADQVVLAEGMGVQSYYRQLPPRTKLAFASLALPTGLAGLA